MKKEFDTICCGTRYCSCNKKEQQKKGRARGETESGYSLVKCKFCGQKYKYSRWSNTFKKMSKDSNKNHLVKQKQMPKY